MEYYSQHGQDHYIDDLLRHKQDGFFVDIGALDGIAISNTYFFEKYRGWTGICIEPKQDSFEKLVQNRTCKCIRGCLSNRPGPEIDFLDIVGYCECLSGIPDTYDPRHQARIDAEVECYGNEGKPSTLHYIKVPNCRFNDVVEQTEIDFVSLDTEGSELEILQSIDFQKYNIRCFTIENNYSTADIPTFMSSKGYRMVARLGCDEVYAK